MFTKHQLLQFQKYNTARAFFVKRYDILIRLESYVSDIIWKILLTNLADFKKDYNEASFLYPFWQKYPPDERGRQPKGDQYPWIEVGEHVFGSKFSRILPKYFSVRDCGIPTGPDERFVISSPKIKEICENFTDSCWLFLDIKSVGPRDDAPHTVMSHNQISGDGIWLHKESGVENHTIFARGKRQSHPFYCAIPPIYVLGNGKILPVVHIVIKPIYSMIKGKKLLPCLGQPLHKVELITIPNGLLLTENPNYIDIYPNLFFPGKDEKDKNPKKMRARVSFDLLIQIDKWRVKNLVLNGH